MRPNVLSIGVLLILLALIGTLPLAGAQEKTLNIALGSEPDTLNPMHDDIAFDIIKIFSGLVKSDANLEIVPDLARSWEVSQDGKTYTVHLRDGVKWHDGKDFTADDVVFTYDLMRSGKWVSLFTISSNYDIINDIRVVDPKTLKFTLNDVKVSFLESLALPILPKHILDGQDLTKTDFWQKPVGTGPYKFKSWDKGEKLVMDASPDYYGEAPKSLSIRYIFVPDEAARVNLLKSGEVDAIKIQPKSASLLEKEKGIKIYSTPSANWYSLNMPNMVWPFNTKNVRKAIAYSIDKQNILDTILAGQGEIAYGPIRKASWAYNPDIAFSYDPKKAKELLEEDGFKAGSDGVYEKDGKKLEFDLLYTTSSPERKNIAIAVSTDLSKVGIKANLVGLDKMNNEQRHSTWIRAGGNPMDPDNYNYKEFNTEFLGVGTWNLANYTNPEVDKLLKDGRTTFDKEKRKQIYGKLQSILADDEPTGFIVFSNDVYAISDKISGIKTRNAPHGGSGTQGSICCNIWWNAGEWTKA